MSSSTSRHRCCRNGGHVRVDEEASDACLGQFPLKVLAGLKFVRGTTLDVFAYTDERRAERADLTDYLADIDLITEMTTIESIDSAKQLANAPSKLKGYGHVRTVLAERGSKNEISIDRSLH